MNAGLLKVLKQHTGDECGKAALAVTTEKVEASAALWTALKTFAAEEGWLCLTDKVVRVQSLTDLEAHKGRIILSGELTKGDHSLHIRQSETGWTLAYLTAGQGDECLKLKESFISTEESQAVRLTYEVYWKSDASAYAPYAFRFTGFAKGETQS